MQYQYSNLSYMDFEELAKDLMSIKLNIKLHVTNIGKDGGIDVADNLSNPTKIIQVKHYENSKFANLTSSLKKELDKLDKFKDLKQYFIFTSMNLSTNKKEEIFKIFQKYMESTDNIVDKKDIEVMLGDKKYDSVLTNHFKLWLNNKSLEMILAKNPTAIDIDSDSFLELDNGEDLRFFVETSQFRKAKKILDQGNFLFITGNPGVGKTLMTRILAGIYLRKGYAIRTTSDINNLSELKTSVAGKPKVKEIIVLDDCLGQTYLRIKDTQGNELKSFIKHIEQNKNKKIILNSRITILNEGERMNKEFKSFHRYKENNFLLLDLSEFDKLEKAKILYNHLYFYSDKENEEYLHSIEEIKKDKNYLKIINHQSFNPRIIKNITRKNKINKQNYLEFIIKNLNNPEDVWKDEYENNKDKIHIYLLWTIYTLSEGKISYKFVKKSFNKMIEDNPNSNKANNEFEQAIERFSNSFIKKYFDNSKDEYFLSVFDPSVNDFLSNYLNKNENLKKYLIKNSSSVEQYEKLLNPEEFKIKINKLFNNKMINNLNFENEISKIRYLSCYISKSYKVNDNFDFYIKILNEFFIYFENNINEMKDVDAQIIMDLLKNLDYNFIIELIIEKEIILLKFLSFLELEELIEITNYLFTNRPFSEELKIKMINIIEDDTMFYFVNSFDFDCEFECFDYHDFYEEITDILKESKIFNYKDFKYNHSADCNYYESENNFYINEEDKGKELKEDSELKIIDNMFKIL